MNIMIHGYHYKYYKKDWINCLEQMDVQNEWI